jgi:hypothetical protein
MQNFSVLFLLTLNLIWGMQPDTSVQWGYKAVLKPGTSLEELKSLRKVLKAKGVAILYPSDRDWKLPTGYLSLSSSWDAGEIEKLSPLIASIKSAELTQRYKLHLVSSTNSQQVTKLLKAFTSNKIQVFHHDPGEVSSFFLVKTALTPEQIKQIEEIGPYIESIER